MKEPPAELRVFHPGSLTGAELREAFAEWRDRRMKYSEENGWPGGLLVLIQQNHAVRRKMLNSDK